MRSFWPISTNTSARRGSVFVGLSGGVDSATSAALLQKEGREVVGAFIRISMDGYPCTAQQDKLDAQRVAAHLKISFVEVDLSREYKQRVLDESLAQWSRGRTPNPDALCNREIKFGLFFDWCMRQGAEYVATGHYAQVKNGELYAGADSQKDQSYFLCLVPQENLAKTLFPIGHMQKSEVRALAKKIGLPNAARRDSQGLCFLGPTNVEDLLMRELHPKPGAVLNEEGAVVGAHRGVALYTLGQRHGFEVEVKGTRSSAHYVIAKDAAANTITVSENKFPRRAQRTVIELANFNRIGRVMDGPCDVRYRYRGKLIPARLSGNTVELNEPHYVPEGQVLALYQHDRCLGGAVIDKQRIH